MLSKKFDLKKSNDNQCKFTFRFLKNHIYDLNKTPNIPVQITCYNNVCVDGVQDLCAVVDHFAYPCRLIDMIQVFARLVPHLSIICNQMTNLKNENWNHLLSNLNKPWFSQQCLKGF